MAKKKNEPGRPAGAIDKKNNYARAETFHHFRCSEGFTRCVDELLKSGLYKSKADVIHHALSVLVLRHNLESKEFKFYKDKIL